MYTAYPCHAGSVSVDNVVPWLKSIGSNSIEKKLHIVFTLTCQVLLIANTRTIYNNIIIYITFHHIVDKFLIIHSFGIWGIFWCQEFVISVRERYTKVVIHWTPKLVLCNKIKMVLRWHNSADPPWSGSGHGWCGASHTCYRSSS